MKYRLLCFLILSTFLTLAGFGIASVHATNKLLISVSQSNPANGALKVINSKTAVNLGDKGYITIQGKPGVKYTVKTYFKKGDMLYHVAQWRTAGTDGMVTFEWDVGYDTVPGTNNAVISGGGETLNLSHTVFE